MQNDVKAVGAIVGAASAVGGTSSVTVATITSSAPGILVLWGLPQQLLLHFQ